MKIFHTHILIAFIFFVSSVNSQPNLPRGPSPPGGFPPAPGGPPGVGARAQPFGFGGNAGGLNAFTNLGGTPGFGGAGAGAGFGGTPGFGGAGAGAGFGGTPGFGGFGGNQFGNVGLNPALAQAGRTGFSNIRSPIANQPYQFAPTGGLQGAQPGGAIGGTNALASLFQGQNVGAGMSVDQMRQLDNALFSGNAGLFQTEQPSTTFNFPLNTQTSAAPTTTFTTQQFSPLGPGPIGGPANPLGPAAASLLGNTMNQYGQQQQYQNNPAYNSLTNGFNNLLSGVGAGLANAGRDIASGYAPPTLTSNPNVGTGYLQNPIQNPVASTTPISTSTGQQYAMPSYSSAQQAAPVYGSSPQHTLTATYPGIGNVNLGVPIVGQGAESSLRGTAQAETERSGANVMETSSMQTKRVQEVA